MGAPETGTGVQVVGSWQTIQPGLPQVYTDVLGDVQALLGALLTLLNTALKILQVVKAFLVGIIDPITLTLDALITEIQGLIADVQEIGIYVSGDLVLDPPQFTSILGGFQGYERRMVGRLVNRNDPTRPNFTPASACVALFTYASTDTSGIRDLTAKIQKLAAFLGQVTPRVESFTVPVNLTVRYGVDGTTLNTFGPLARQLLQGKTPTSANLRWMMAPPVTGAPVAYPYLAPKGFLLEVSTLKDGLFLKYDARTKNANTQLDSYRTNGVVLDPKTQKPFRLYGGSLMVDTWDLTAVHANHMSNTDTSTVLYACRDLNDNVPIPLDGLVTSEGYLLQRTFFVPWGYVNTIGPGQGFAGVLRAEDMPYEAEFQVGNDGVVVPIPESIQRATTVYVRVSAVTEAISDKVKYDTTKALTAPLAFWDISSASIVAQSQGLGKVALTTGGDYAPSDKSDPSEPLVVTFPDTTAQEYIEAVTTALAVLVLARADVRAVVPVGVDPDTTPVDMAAEVDAARARVENIQREYNLQDEQYQNFPLSEPGVDPVELTRRFEALADDLAQTYSRLSAAENALRLTLQQQAQYTAYVESNPSFRVGQGRRAIGLEDVGKLLVPQIVSDHREGVDQYFGRTYTPPEAFRDDLLTRCRAVATDLYNQTGRSPELEKLAVEQAQVLLDFKWSDIDQRFPALGILESLQDTETYRGVGLNPLSFGTGGDKASLMLEKTLLPRNPGFFQRGMDTAVPFQMMGLGSVDYSPVIYHREIVFGPTYNDLTMQFCRNAFFQVPGFYDAVAAVLNIAAAPNTLEQGFGGEWTAVRLFPQGMPALNSFLQEIQGFALTTSAGMSAVTDVILAYIAFLEARVLELQSFVLRLDGLLQIMESYNVPSMSALVVTGNGTAGVLQALVSATGKPVDTPETYGAGMVILAGGLPSLLVEILLAFFPES